MISAPSPKTQQATVRRIQEPMDGEAAQGRYMLNRCTAIMEEQRRSISRRRRDILTGRAQPVFLYMAQPEKFKALCAAGDAAGVLKAERRLTLYYSGLHWADYLATLVHFSRNMYIP